MAQMKPVQLLIPPSEKYSNNAGIKSDNHAPGHGRASDLYDTTLSWWRAGVRRKLVSAVDWESQIIAKMQVSRMSVEVFGQPFRLKFFVQSFCLKH